MKQRLKISVIDDCIENLRIIKAFLSREESLDPKTYIDPELAIEDIENGECFDLLITDFNLASDSYNGIDVLAAYKNRLPEIKSILISGDDDKNWKEAGFDSFFLKPFSLRTLVDEVKNTQVKLAI